MAAHKSRLERRTVKHYIRRVSNRVEIDPAVMRSCGDGNSAIPDTGQTCRPPALLQRRADTAKTRAFP